MRIFFWLLVVGVATSLLSAQRGSLDPAFENFPFDQWLNQNTPGPFHWSVKVPRAELSFHQRFVSSIDINLDGKDMDTRRRNGKLLLLIQITDAAEIRYQEHGEIDLGQLDPNVKDANLEYTQHAFFLPGDYKLAVAVVDSVAGEHSISQTRFRIPPAHDFLALAWRNLPAVEFIGNDVSPKSWYLPYIQGQLQWASSVRSAIRLNVILNVAPSGKMRGGDMAALIPTLKVISHTGSPSISEHVALLDISRRKTVFDQTDVRDLDWLKLKSSLGEANTASIDLHSLADRHENAQFFVSEVRRMLRTSLDNPCALIVLSQPVSFDSGEDLEPISLEALPPCHVFYLRYHAPPRPPGPLMGQAGGLGRRSRMNGPMLTGRFSQDPFDQLEPTLKPLSPKVFDVDSPELVTKALADIEKALLKLADSAP